MVGYEMGRKLGRKLRYRRAASLAPVRPRKREVWATRYPVRVLLGALVLCALAAWGLAATRDGATTADLVFWELVLVPLGVLATGLALLRIRRRRPR